MVRQRHEPGPPMDLANTRRQGGRNLMAYCLNDSCRHQGIIDVSEYSGDTPVPWFRSKVKCAKCGARNNRIDVQTGKRRRARSPTGAVDRPCPRVTGEISFPRRGPADWNISRNIFPAFCRCRCPAMA
jgi:hypothetical protein